MSKFTELINGTTPVLVDMFATWCGPCQTLAPILKEVKADLGEKLKIIKIDVDKNQELATKFDVRGVPTLILFKEGIIKWRQSGLVEKQQLIDVVKQYN